MASSASILPVLGSLVRRLGACHARGKGVLFVDYVANQRKMTEMDDGPHLLERYVQCVRDAMPGPQ